MERKQGELPTRLSTLLETPDNRLIVIEKFSDKLPVFFIELCQLRKKSNIEDQNCYSMDFTASLNLLRKDLGQSKPAIFPP